MKLRGIERYFTQGNERRPAISLYLSVTSASDNQRFLLSTVCVPPSPLMSENDRFVFWPTNSAVSGACCQWPATQLNFVYGHFGYPKYFHSLHVSMLANTYHSPVADWSKIRGKKGELKGAGASGKCGENRIALLTSNQFPQPMTPSRGLSKLASRVTVIC